MGFSKIGDFTGYLGGIGAIQAFRKPVDFYDKVTFHGATRQIVIEDGTIKGFTISGDIASDNWDGGDDLSGGADGTATAGYLLDYSSGAAQFQTIYAEGGVLGTLDITGSIEIASGGTIYGLSGIQSMSLQPGGGGFTITGDGTSGQSLDIVNVVNGISVGVGNSGAVPQTYGLQVGDSGGTYYQVLGSGHTYAPDGTAGAPAYAFKSDTDTGMYLAGTNAIGFAAGGSKKFVITTQYAGSSNATGTPQMKVDAAGSATTPSYSFQSVTNAGMYWTGSGVAIAIGGTRQLFVDSGGMTIGDGATTGQATFRDTGGSVSAPVYTFIGDTDTGIYRAGADTMGLTCGGNLIMSMNYTGGVKEVYIYGLTGTGSYNSVRVDTGTGKLYYLTSSRRFKTKITDAPYLSSVALRPRMFWQKNDKAWQYGLIAEEVAEVLPEAAVYQDEKVVNYDDRAVLAVLVAKVNRLEQALKDCHECGRIDRHDKEQS